MQQVVNNFMIVRREIPAARESGARPVYREIASRSLDIGYTEERAEHTCLNIMEGNIKLNYFRRVFLHDLTFAELHSAQGLSRQFPGC